MKRKLVVLVILICTTSLVPVFGQEPPPAMEAAHNTVVRFLQLDDSQAAAWDGIYADHRAAEQPLRENIRDLEAELQELFDTENPDPAAVGALVIEIRSIREALFELDQSYNEDFMALLSEEQLNRLKFIRRADDVQKFIPAFKAFELIRRN